MVEALAAAGTPCWIDEQQLTEGAELRASLRDAIAHSDVYLYFVSKAANESKWVQDELQFALGLEFQSKINIIPVRLAESDVDLPPRLAGRVYSSLEVTGSGAARLAHRISSRPGHDRLPDSCRLSATVRIDDHRLVHTLQWPHPTSADRLDVLFLNNDYDNLPELYWHVADVSLPRRIKDTEKRLAYAAEVIAHTHARCRVFIRELAVLCTGYLSIDPTARYRHYYETAHERAMRFIMQSLLWKITYLRHWNGGPPLDEDFLEKEVLPDPFSAHSCEFEFDGECLGTLEVPKHGHPWPSSIERPIPWGMRSPFTDLAQSEVGMIVGQLIGLRLRAGTLDSAKIPPAESLTYGLA
jgi:hypothetical protein